jgi:hypothetical protein
VYRLAPNYCYAPNLSLRRDVMDRVGGFDPYFRYGGQDVDLGYRLTAAGVRLVYEPEAIAWHDHPMTLSDYFRRQAAAGISSMLLESRYPELEGGPGLWDAVLASYFTYPRAMLDRDQHVVDTLEPIVASAHPHYQETWKSVHLTRSRDPGALDPGQRKILDAVQTLFTAYDRLLKFHWGKAFIDATVERHGAPSLGERVRARLVKCQTTLQQRRIAQHRLAERGLGLELCRAGDALDTLVVHGVESYFDAITALMRFHGPHEGTNNRQILLVAEERCFTADELDKLDELAEVVRCRRTDEGLSRALGAVRSEVVSICSGRVFESCTNVRWIARKFFERMERLLVISGGSARPGADRLVVGRRFDGSAVTVRVRDRSGTGDAVPVEVPNPDYLLLRGDTARALADPGSALAGEDGDAWALALGRFVAERGGMICHVPDMRCDVHAPRGATPEKGAGKRASSARPAAGR